MPHHLPISSPKPSFEHSTEHDLLLAAKAIRDGEAVAIPTETVYGLAADASNDRAVLGLYAKKGRPSGNPLIVHIPNLACAELYGEFNPSAHKLATAFWPGPLTIVVNRKHGSNISPYVTAGSTTIALRAPAHPIAARLLAITRLPLAAPSANQSGCLSPTLSEHVKAAFPNDCPIILEGGACRLGIESTVVSCIYGQPQILRSGAITFRQLGKIVKLIKKLTVSSLQLDNYNSSNQSQQSPGIGWKHYAPKTPIRLNAQKIEQSEAMLTFGSNHPPYSSCIAWRNLSPSGDIKEAAANLFDYMHHLDRVGASSIAVTTIPKHGIGIAINDRLQRAAAQ